MVRTNAAMEPMMAAIRSIPSLPYRSTHIPEGKEDRSCEIPMMAVMNPTYLGSFDLRR